MLGIGGVATAHLEQAHRHPRRARGCAARGGDAGRGAATGASPSSSSLIGLASVQAPPPKGRRLLLGDEAPRHRLVSPRAAAARRAAALDAAARRSRSGFGHARHAASGGRRGHCRSPAMRTTSSTRSAVPSTSRRQLGTVTVRSRSRSTAEAERFAGWSALPLRPARRGRPAPAARPGSIARWCMLDRRRGRARIAAGACRRQIEARAGGDGEAIVEEGGIDAALEAASARRW